MPSTRPRARWPLAIPAYFVPFAVFQLVSGTIGERLGRRRVVRAGYVAYAVASVAAAVAPTIGLFIVARAASGTANAFLTPLLLAGLAEAHRARALGRGRWGPSPPCRPPRLRSPPRSAACSARSTGGWRSSPPAAVAIALAFVPPPDARAPGRRRACAPAGGVHAPRRPAVGGGLRGLRGRHQPRLPRRAALQRRVRPGLQRARRGAGRLRRRRHGLRPPVGAARRPPRADLGDRRRRLHLRGARRRSSAPRGASPPWRCCGSPRARRRR